MIDVSDVIDVTDVSDVTDGSDVTDVACDPSFFQIFREEANGDIFKWQNLCGKDVSSLEIIKIEFFYILAL